MRATVSGSCRRKFLNSCSLPENRTDRIGKWGEEGEKIRAGHRAAVERTEKEWKRREKGERKCSEVREANPKHKSFRFPDRLWCSHTSGISGGHFLDTVSKVTLILTHMGDQEHRIYKNVVPVWAKNQSIFFLAHHHLCMRIYSDGDSEQPLAESSFYPFYAVKCWFIPSDSLQRLLWLPKGPRSTIYAVLNLSLGELLLSSSPTSETQAQYRVAVNFKVLTKQLWDNSIKHLWILQL